VADAVRSLSFYRDVLGFTLNWQHPQDGIPSVAEVQLAQAKIQFGAHDGVRDNPEQRSARRATILFFETNDVAALHAGIKKRGGKAGELKVVEYWMRMQIFSISDPDDHSIWFGQRLSN